MGDSNLCQFCCGLVFWDMYTVGYTSHKYYRTLKELQNSSETTTCPFCSAFYDSLLAARPDAKADTRCKFSSHTQYCGFIELAILFSHTLLGEEASNEYGFVTDCDDDGKYLEDICHWMIAYAESKSHILRNC